MPNWVMNELTCIFQTSVEYNAFKVKADFVGLYDSFIPRPEILENTLYPPYSDEEFIALVNRRNNTKFLTVIGIALAGDEWDSKTAKSLMQNEKALLQTGYSNWYDWCEDNWGVKWDASECKVNFLPDFNTIVFSFNSPWNTPEKFVKNLSALYPDATFEMVSGSIENDTHYEFTCEGDKYEVTCSYDSFKEAVEDGKWGGIEKWEILFEESEEV
jgi:hypothetical protein